MNGGTSGMVDYHCQMAARNYDAYQSLIETVELLLAQVASQAHAGEVEQAYEAWLMVENYREWAWESLREYNYHMVEATVYGEDACTSPEEADYYGCEYISVHPF